MASWAVFKVRSLFRGGAGQSLERLGTVDANSFAEAIGAARVAFHKEADPQLPDGGLAVIARDLT
jgi:hypothetical protein